jgi:hypothetical protein
MKSTALYSKTLKIGTNATMPNVINNIKNELSEKPTPFICVATCTSPGTMQASGDALCFV